MNKRSVTLPCELSMRCSVSFLLTLVALAGGGCWGNNLGATVSGTVTLDGEPVGPGVVTFAADNNTAEPAVGQLGSDGSYQLSTGDQRGLAPGTYRVAVQAFQPPENLAAGERSFEPSKPLVPEKFMKVSTSGLQFDVAAGHNSIDLALTRQ